MGSKVSKNNIFTFEEVQYNQLIGYIMNNKADDNNNILKSLQSCTITSLCGTCIDSIYINIVCNATSRIVCSICMRDEIHRKNKFFMISKFKYDHEINDIVNSFKIMI